MTIQEQYENLEKTVRGYNPAADFQHIRAAFEFAAEAHKDQKRKSGEPYIIHPLAVAQIVAEELRLDSESIEAALLHDVIEDTAATHEQVSKLFSPTIADLVEGVSKLTRIQYATKEDEQMENLRKMLIAMSKDIRVILIKISDRLHNMRTMEYQSPAKQKQKSLETMEIYAPISHRLGMQRIKWELEDLSLKYLDPIGYQEIVSKLDAKRQEYEAFMQRTQVQIDDRLNELGIQHIVYGRMKHPYSIYRKMFNQNKSLDEIFDLFAFRVIVENVGDCYNVLGVIHDIYKPILGRFKDYIGTPKPNGYQSLHTTVIGREGIPFEVQIRTWEMHMTAEYGVAAHWKYKTGSGEGRRVSATLSEKTVYIALRLSDGTVLRAAASHYTVPTLLFGILQPLILIIVLAVALSAFLASRLSKRIVGPLNAIDLDHPLENETYDELSPLLTRVERQQRQISGQLEELGRRRREFEAVTGSMSEGLILLDAEGRVLSINGRAKALRRGGRTAWARTS